MGFDADEVNILKQIKMRFDADDVSTSILKQIKMRFDAELVNILKQNKIEI